MWACVRVYLGEVEEVCVGGSAQGVHGPPEGVDLLVGVSHQDLSTALGQQHVHDGYRHRGAPHKVKGPFKKKNIIKKIYIYI